MPKYIVVPTSIKPADVIDFSKFDVHEFARARTEIQETEIEGEIIQEEVTVYDIENYTQITKPLENMEASDEVLNFNLRQAAWTPYRYTTSRLSTEYLIGYANTKNTDSVGETEVESYSVWISDWKKKEKNFQKLFPVKELTQAQYDAMLSLYVNTGSYLRVGSEIASFDIKPYLETGAWDYIATALVKSTGGRQRTQAEAKMMMLGFYGKYIPRTLIKQRGLENLQANYSRIKDALAKQQAEYIYFVETGNFLPGLQQARKRQIVQQYERLQK